MASAQRMHLDVRADRDRGGELDELAGILARDVRDAPDAALPPEQVVRELRHAIEMDGVDRDGAAAIERAQRRDDDVAHRREGDGRIERLGRRVVVAAGPHGAELERASLLRLGSRADVHAAPPVHGDLDREARRGAEAEQPEATSRLDPADPERAVADHAAAQERRGGEVVDRRGQPHDHVGPGRRVLGVAAVAIPAGEGRGRAEVLAALPAPRARSVGAGEPRDPRPVADAPARGSGAELLDVAHDLVPGNHGQASRREIALGQLQVGATDAAGGDAQQQLSGARHGPRQVARHERRRRRRSGLFEHERPHGYQASRRAMFTPDLAPPCLRASSHQPIVDDHSTICVQDCSM